MKRTFALLALSVSLTATPAVRADGALPDTEAAVRDVVNWLKKTNKFGPEDSLVRDMTRFIRRDIGTYNDLTLILGNGLTKSGQGAMMVLWAGHLFTRSLSDAELRAFDVKPTSASYRQGRTSRDKRQTDAGVALGTVTLDGGRSLDGSREVTGAYTCKVTSSPGKKVALRLSYSVGGSTTSKFVWLDNLKQGNHTFRFSFKPIHEGGKGRTGPLLVVFDLCTVEDMGNRVVMTLLGDSKPKLVEVR